MYINSTPNLVHRSEGALMQYVQALGPLVKKGYTPLTHPSLFAGALRQATLDWAPDGDRQYRSDLSGYLARQTPDILADLSRPLVTA